MSDQSPGETEWIRGVLEQHETALLRYATRLTGDPEHARDIVQETFLRLCRVPRATLDGHVGPWLFRVCRQRALDSHRAEQHMPIAATHVIDGHICQEAGPAERMERKDESHHVLELLALLPANQQEVVHLRFQAGLSYRQISEVTGLSVSNVGFLLHTALARLREQTNATDAHGNAVHVKGALNGNSLAGTSSNRERLSSERLDGEQWGAVR
ncbi:MAG TPA: sigma-70 family RNA polymerase sigma factor [Pirellulales bacterium]|jgi:RNA polymerase sigma-70 factor (ECF subfamily)